VCLHHTLYTLTSFRPSVTPDTHTHTNTHTQHMDSGPASRGLPSQTHTRTHTHLHTEPDSRRKGVATRAQAHQRHRDASVVSLPFFTRRVIVSPAETQHSHHAPYANEAPRSRQRLSAVTVRSAKNVKTVAKWRKRRTTCESCDVKVGTVTLAVAASRH
jgi:hypothetical protein